MTDAAPGFERLCRICAAVLRSDSAPDESASADLLALAERHRVVPLLAAAGGPAPDVRRRALALAQQGVRLECELAAIAAILAAADVGFLLLKGPALARQAYPAAERRACDDLDLWVATCDLDAAATALVGAGYRRESALDARAAACARRAGIEVAFRHADRSRLVEVAHGDPALAPTRRAAREIRAAAVELAIAGARIRAPAPGHALVLACLHGAHHGWDRLGWVVDVAGLWLRLTAPQRQAALAAARRWSAATALGLGLRLAATHLGIELDAAALALADSPRVRRLIGRVGLERMGPAAPRADMIARLRFERDAADAPAARWRIAARWLFVPTLGDIAAVRLPAAGYPLYALVRPLRLLRHPWLREWLARP